MPAKKQNSLMLYIPYLIIVVCLVVSWKVLVPRIKEGNQQLATVSAETSAANDKLNSLKSTQTTLASLGNLVDMALTAVPKDTDLPNLLAELEALAIKNQLAIPNVQVAEGKVTAGSGGKVSINFAVNGPYANISSFVDSIESDIRFMNIRTISFSGTTEKMTTAFQIEAYKRLKTDETASVSGVATATSAEGAAQ